jgi:pyruvate/2-oxoglutarate dehydrogenase complex dihydrolipoamide dehydrogenase (E3) component
VLGDPRLVVGDVGKGVAAGDDVPRRPDVGRARPQFLVDGDPAGVVVDPRRRQVQPRHDVGGIAVDDELRTSAPHVWAAGDVVSGGHAFTHVADYQARIAEHNALSGRPPLRTDYRAVPWAIFTDPELGRVGLTEREAREAGHDVKCATVAVRDLARAITAGETDGLVKLVSDRRTGRLLGGHALAARGGELLGEVALAIRLGLPVSALCDTLHAYPTFSEGVFWAAYELAKPDDPALDAVRGVQAPRGDAAERETA